MYIVPPVKLTTGAYGSHRRSVHALVVVGTGVVVELVVVGTGVVVVLVVVGIGVVVELVVVGIGVVVELVVVGTGVVVLVVVGTGGGIHQLTFRSVRGRFAAAV